MSCLGDASRFQLVALLLRGERCVSDLAQAVGLSQSCTTRHLQALQREQLVRGERDGKRVMFHLCLDDPEVRALVAWAISERAGRRGDSPSLPARPSHGGDLHSDGPRPAARVDVLRPAAAAGPLSSARRPEEGRAADPPRVDAAVEHPQPEPVHDDAEPSPPAPRRPPRHDLEDFLL